MSTKKIEDSIEEIKESQVRMEVDVKHHIKRTDLLEDLHADNALRIAVLEEPQKARAYIKSLILDVGKFTGFILSVIAIAKYFDKL